VRIAFNGSCTAWWASTTTPRADALSNLRWAHPSPLYQCA